MKIWGAAVTLTFAFSAMAADPVDLPDWLMKKINSESPPTAVSVLKIRYRTYYLVDAPCCDQYNYIYNESGAKLCAKDGGKDGRGDGKCTKFIPKKELDQTWQSVWRQGEIPKN